MKLFDNGSVYLTKSKIHGIGLYAAKTYSKEDVITSLPRCPTIKIPKISYSSFNPTQQDILISYFDEDDDNFYFDLSYPRCLIYAYFGNHGNSTNIGRRIVANKDIEKDEELTWDYSASSKRNFGYGAIFEKNFYRKAVTSPKMTNLPEESLLFRKQATIKPSLIGDTFCIIAARKLHKGESLFKDTCVLLKRSSSWFESSRLIQESSKPNVKMFGGNIVVLEEIKRGEVLYRAKSLFG